MKKFLAILIAFMLLFASGCSKEDKFGMEQFVTRMNKEYNFTLSTSDFMLCKKDEQNILFYDDVNSLITLSVDSENEIIGIGLTITTDCDIGYGTDLFCCMSAVFTGNTYNDQKSILSDCNIATDKIKFADSNAVITVGRFKYTIVCNEYSITLFCDRV